MLSAIEKFYSAVPLEVAAFSNHWGNRQQSYNYFQLQTQFQFSTVIKHQLCNGHNFPTDRALIISFLKSWLWCWEWKEGWTPCFSSRGPGCGTLSSTTRKILGYLGRVVHPMYAFPEHLLHLLQISLYFWIHWGKCVRFKGCGWGKFSLHKELHVLLLRSSSVPSPQLASRQAQQQIKAESLKALGGVLRLHAENV